LETNDGKVIVLFEVKLDSKYKKGQIDAFRYTYHKLSYYRIGRTNDWATRGHGRLR